VLGFLLVARIALTVEALDQTRYALQRSGVRWLVPDGAEVRAGQAVGY
jgi:hypothetical protein